MITHVVKYSNFALLVDTTFNVKLTWSNVIILNLSIHIPLDALVNRLNKKVNTVRNIKYHFIYR